MPSLASSRQVAISRDCTPKTDGPHSAHGAQHVEYLTMPGMASRLLSSAAWPLPYVHQHLNALVPGRADVLTGSAIQQLRVR